MSIHLRHLPLLIGAFTSAGQLSAQSDNCFDAYTLIMGTSCVPQAGSVYNASSSIPAISCNGDMGTADEDVWFQFVATATDATIDVTCFPGFDGVVDLRSGACPGNNIACADNAGENQNESFSVTGLILGATYYIRVYEYGNGVPDGFDFNICVWSPNAISGPENDDCAQAIVLIPGAACDPVSGSAAGATDSNVSASCNGQGTSDDDVWYSFVATNGHVRVIVDADGTYDPIVHLRFGCPGNSIACTNQTGAGGTEVIDIDAIIVGNTYLVQIYDAGTGQPLNTSFTICVQNIDGTISIGEDNAGGPWRFGPTSDPRLFSLNCTQRGPTTWAVFDAVGRQVMDQVIHLLPGATATLDMHALPAGAYTIVLAGNGARAGMRFVLP